MRPQRANGIVDGMIGRENRENFKIYNKFFTPKNKLLKIMQIDKLHTHIQGITYNFEVSMQCFTLMIFNSVFRKKFCLNLFLALSMHLSKHLSLLVFCFNCLYFIVIFNFNH